MFRAYPGLFLLGMIIPGIVLADLFHTHEWIYLLLALLFCLLGFLSLNRPKQLLPIILFGICVLSFSAFNFGLRFYPTGANHVTKFADNNENYHIYGEVVDWPRVKVNSTEIKVRLDSLSSDYFYPVQCMVMLKISDTTTSLERGDRIEFYGKIYSVKGGRSPGGFNYQRYLNLKGIHGIVYLTTLLDVRVDKRNRYEIVALADKIREVILSSLRKNLTPTTSALAAGFLIGETRDIPGDIYNWFRDSGTMHLLAVSGSNVILVIIFFTFLLKPFRVSGNKRALILLIVLLMFTLISYGEPSVIRASLMAALILLAGMIGRSYNLNNIISITAAIILLVDPAQLFDVGFQLSFVTAWGLIFVVPVIHEKFENYHNRLWYRYLILPALVSFVAQICSGPLIVLYFQRLPIISVAANLVIVMLTSIAVIGVLALLVADLILPMFGLLVGSIVNKLIELIIICLKFFGGQEIPVITTGIVPISFVFLFYVLLIFGVWSLTSKPVRRLWVMTIIITLNCLLLVPVVNSFRVENKTDFWITSIPGGIAGFIKKQGSINGDLIVSGLYDRDYPVDDRILKPIMDNLGIKKLNSVFIVASDFGSLKDLTNLISDFDTDSVFISDRLANSIKDIIIQSGFHKFEQRVKTLKTPP
ncbi:MAG: ComEC/Rec2 family competence protein, partial [bacterium]